MNDAPDAAPDMPERLGNFRLIERLGVGGMGVVYRARDEVIERDVALKLISPEHLFFNEARERFRREVEAAAKLNHPGVVPIYSVGEEHGLPFFTMELVEGCSLATVIEQLRNRAPQSLTGADLREAIGLTSRRFHDTSSSSDFAQVFSGTWVQACCRLALQVAEALQHAHERGVLHRDVKPSNIVVTPGGRAMLLDFGLASDEHSSRITRTLSQVGSWPYMPPERVRGGLSNADARGDVYSLGVALYELLALRLPFDGGTMQERFSAIAGGACKPLRECNPAVAWDAATVCASAMERDAERRYATAGDFARDLRNLLELRPITARVPSTTLRARRWVQRHPTASVACALGFLLLVVAPSVAWWRIKRERDAALQELSARQGMLAFLLEVIDAADPEARGEAGQRSLQEVVEEGTQRIREQFKDSPEVRIQLLLNLATIQHKLGRTREARDMSEEALGLARTLYGAESIDTAIGERDLATSLVALGEYDRARELLNHALQVAERQPNSRITPWIVEADIAAALLLERRIDEARELLERLGKTPGAPVHEDGQERVQWLTNLAEVEKGSGHFDEAAALLQDAVDCATRVWGRKHSSTARSLQNLAALHIDRGQAELAIPELDEVRDIRAQIGAKEGIEDARLAYNLAVACNKLGKLDVALAQFQHSLELTRRFAGDSAQTASASVGVGALLFKLEHLDEAETMLRESLSLSRRYFARHGLHAAEAPMWLARCRMKQGHSDEAVELWTEVFECVRDDPQVPAPLLAKLEGEFADALAALGRSDEAAQHRERAQQIQDAAATSGG